MYFILATVAHQHVVTPDTHTYDTTSEHNNLEKGDHHDFEKERQKRGYGMICRHIWKAGPRLFSR